MMSKLFNRLIQNSLSTTTHVKSDINRLIQNSLSTTTHVKSDRGWTKDRNDPTTVNDYPFYYRTREGKRYDTLATVIVERVVTKCRWIPFFKSTQYWISIEFDQEIGYLSDSFFGGSVGCYFSMLPNETVTDVLDRLKRDKVFG